MLTYKNETDKDVEATIRPSDPKALPTEIIIKAGETYDVPAELEADFLRWMMDAKTQDNGTPDKENENKNETTDTEVQEDEDSRKEAKTESIKNDREFDIEINYKENGEEKTMIVKAGEEIKIPAEEAEAVKKQITEAKEKSDGGEAKTNSEKNEKEDALAEERHALEEERANIAKERAELQFDKLCESGKVVPAQKQSFMALATQSNVVALAEGDNKTVSELLEDFIQSAPAHSLMEEEGKSGEGEADVELTDEDKRVAETFGNSMEDIKKTRKDD